MGDSIQPAFFQRSKMLPTAALTCNPPFFAFSPFFASPSGPGGSWGSLISKDIPDTADLEVLMGGIGNSIILIGGGIEDADAAMEVERPATPIGWETPNVIVVVVTARGRGTPPVDIAFGKPAFFIRFEKSLWNHGKTDGGGGWGNGNSFTPWRFWLNDYGHRIAK